ncbi:MAG TPA: hypothetical protein VN380_00265 [Thermoanaerobaculia bacterium]|jgi:hypothetical protein|nr:hypothetical protein [Thermoanaerobaculia bacterium]
MNHIARSVLFAFLVSLAVPAFAVDNTPPGDNTPPRDNTPPGMVSFFSGSGCPAGWGIAWAASGRLIVGTTDGPKRGSVVGDPMKDATPPTHTHTFKSASFTMQSRWIAGASACCNNSAAKTDTLWTPEGPTVASDGNLPYLQLTVCQKH